MTDSDNNQATDGIVFVDAKPSEQLYLEGSRHLCFASLSPSNLISVPQLKSFKATKRGKKVADAQRIVDHLVDGTVRINAFVISARMEGAYIDWAIDSVNRARESLGCTWQEVEGLDQPQLVWNNHRFNFPLATGLSVYANVIALIGLRYAVLAAAHGQIKHIKFALHQLPNKSSEGIEFMEALSKADPDIATMWSSNLEHDITFEIGNLKSYLERGKQKPAKFNPHAILVDWLGASAIAKTNPGQIVVEGKYTRNEIDVFASIIETVEDIGAGQLFDMEDHQLNQRIKQYCDSLSN